MKGALRRLNWRLASVRARWRQNRDFFRQARSKRSLPAQFYDLLEHKLRLNANPVEYYRYRWYEKGPTWEQKALYVCNGGARYFPWELNRLDLAVVLRHKYLFKLVVAGLGLPQPALVSTVGPGLAVEDPERLERLLRAERRDLVFKPIEGGGGAGVLIVGRNGDGWLAGGRPRTLPQLWRELGQGRRGYVVEERVEQDPFMASLHPPSLNTVRLITLRTRGGWRILRAYARVGQGGGWVDNCSRGGLSLGLDAAGRTVSAMDWNRRLALTHHPDTGRPLVGLQIPRWPEVEELVLRASAGFQVVGTIGWDVGFSVDGPLLIEGNGFYDAVFTQIEQGPLLTPEIAGELKPHRAFSRWDKRYFYPNIK